MKIHHFNKPTLVGDEFAAISEAIATLHLSGNGTFTKRCQAWLEEHLGQGRVLLTHSCTAALEMSAILAGIEPGDEVIMPSYTFTSTANAFVLRGAKPVFVDIREDTLNIDEALIEPAITQRTKAICVVHYAGVAAAMDPILEVARRRGLTVIEDAAQALFSSYRGRPLGTFGALSAFSFHETKNVISGEGGALAVTDPELIERSEIIWEKGTNRAAFQRGEVAKYTWIDVGSSFLPSDIVAAFLYTQLKSGAAITALRNVSWQRYHEAFAELEKEGLARRPIIPADCTHNAHIYYLLARSPAERARILEMTRARGVHAISHYVPLHSAPAGLKFGRTGSTMARTDDLSERLIRMPLHPQLNEADQDYIATTVSQAVREAARS